MPGACPPPPPPPPCTARATKLSVPSMFASTDMSSSSDCAGASLPQMETPRPRSKMKTLNWNKVPVQNVLGKNNLWAMVAKAHDGRTNDLDFETMEGLFCQVTSGPPSAQASPRLPRKDSKSDTSSLDRKKKEYQEINLLDGKRSLNVNIFLKQFRSSNEEIIRFLLRGQHEEIGAEKLKGLLKILPETDEVELLRGFEGDRNRLGNAEKFLLQLVELSQYKLRIEAMLLKEEFGSNMAYLEPAIENITVAAQEIKDCVALREIMYMVLVAGNFLNSGGYAGNAAGFKMMSLLKLTEIRANKPGINLIHYVAWQAEKKNSQLIRFTDELGTLEEASKVSIDNLKSEISTLSQKVTKISKLVSNAGSDIRNQIGEFLEMALEQTAAVEKVINDLEKERVELAEFLCEDVAIFKLEECFRVFSSFCQKFKVAVEENTKRREQEQNAEARRRQREENLSLKRKSSGASDMRSVSGSESETHIMDMLLGDIRSGFRLSNDNSGSFRVRKVTKTRLESGPELCRMNSLNSSVPSEEELGMSPRVLRRRIGSVTAEEESPDVTPNGSLRKRRSRVSSEEQDDGCLIDYLRQTAEIQDGRDRRSWSSSADGGSLERAWLRRSSRRRRPDHLAPELQERERGASPVTQASATETSGTETEKPKQWRRKIEDWLHESEKEDADMDRRLRERASLDERRKRSQEHESLERRRSHEAPPRVAEVQPQNLAVVHEARTDSELRSKESPDTESESHSVKDKSKWRKSTLNVANSTESVEEDRRRRRRTGVCSADSRSVSDVSVHSGVRSSSPERSTDEPLPEVQEDAGKTAVVAPSRREEKKEEETDNRANRRSLRYKNLLESTPNAAQPVAPDNPESSENQFDRFSLIRKTTRKARGKTKNSDPSEESTEETEANTSRRTSRDKSSDETNNRDNVRKVSQSDIDLDILKALESHDVKKNRPSLRARLAKRFHSLTENIKSATKNCENNEKVPSDSSEKSPVLVSLKPVVDETKETPLEQPCSSSSANDAERRRQEMRKSPGPMGVRRAQASPLFKRRGLEEHENDEGFEETQSLQSAASSCGQDTDGVDSPTANRRDAESPTDNVLATAAPATTPEKRPAPVRVRPSTRIPSPVGSRRRPGISVRKPATPASRTASNSSTEGPPPETAVSGSFQVRRSSIPERINSRSTSPRASVKRYTPSQASRSVSRSSLQSSKSSLSGDGTHTRPKIINIAVVSPTTVIDPQAPRKNKVFTPPRTNKSSDDESLVKIEEYASATPRMQRVSRLPTPESKKQAAPSKTVIPRQTSVRPLRRNEPVPSRNNGFGFMKATSASTAKVSPNKPLDEVQKAKVQKSMNFVAPAKANRSFTTGLRTGGLK